MSEDLKQVQSKITALVLLSLMLLVAATWLVWYILMGITIGLFLLEVFLYGASR